MNYEEVEPIILSVDEQNEISIGEAAKLIADAFKQCYPDMTIELEFDSSFSDGQFKKTASNTKLRKYLPEYQFTKISDGIRETVEWFIQNYHIARK